MEKPNISGDQRSGKIILVAHCILNQNACSLNTANFDCCFWDLINLFHKYKIGILQLPCPELICLGLNRKNIANERLTVLQDNTRIRKLLLEHGSLVKLRLIISSIVDQVIDYRSHGFEIIGLIGINRSPSCGINTTTTNSIEVDGEGIFIKKLRKELRIKNIVLNMVGVKTSNPEESYMKIKKLLHNYSIK